MILIGKNHADYEGIKFVIRAASGDASRFVITKLNVRMRDNRLLMEGTDGRRYHGYYLSGREFVGLDSNKPFEHGIYDYWVTTERDIIINKRTDEGLVFPKTEDVIPKAEGMRKREGVPLDLNEFASRALHLADGSFSIDYMMDICSFKIQLANKSWMPRKSKKRLETPRATIQQVDKNNPLLVTTETMIAVLMPMRFED
jgi:hypothetical protein